MSRNNVSVIIPAAGLSKRMSPALSKKRKGGVKAFAARKPFIRLKNKTVLGRLLPVFKGIAQVREIILVVNKKDIRLAEEKFACRGAKRPVKIVEGGRQRKDSCLRGLSACSKASDIILIHDGARPFITPGLVKKSINTAAKYGACVVAVPVTSTIKQAGKGGLVKNTPARKFLWQAQTPQVFKRVILEKAFKRYKGRAKDVTDDAFLVEKLGRPVKILMGAYDNIKISTPEDLIIAEQILKKQEK